MFTYTDRQFENLTTEVMLMDPATAKAYRDNCAFDRQRSISEDHVRRLAIEMETGGFLAGTPIWLCVLPNGRMLLVNGNHTLEAIIRSKVTIPLTVVYQKVKNENEAGETYVCFDIQRSRTWMQAAQAVGLDQKVPLLKCILSAAPFLMNNFTDTRQSVESKTSSRSARFAVVKEYTKAAVLLHSLLEEAVRVNRNIILRAGNVAVALATLRYQPSTAETFWRGIAMDDGLGRADPRKVLLRYNLDHKVIESRFDIARAASLAWNAYFENRVIANVRPGSMGVFKIAGTPWNGSVSKATAVKASAKTVEKTITGQQIDKYGRVKTVVARVKETIGDRAVA